MAEYNSTAGFLRRWASEKADHPALRWGGGAGSEAEQLTYGQLHERSSRVAQALRAAGVGPGDRVAFLDKNSPEQVELFFGAAQLNAVPCPVNFRLAPPEIATIVVDSEAKVFAVGEEFVPALDKISAELVDVLTLVIGWSKADRPSFALWRDAYPAVDPEEPQSGGDVGYQLYSSGTTGRPKGVQLTQANLTCAMDLYPDVMGFGGDSVSLVAMPLYHIGGGGWALAGFAQGATNVLVRDMVPAILQRMLEVPGIEDRDFSALGSILYGASPISETVLAAAIRTFRCGFVQAYGLTESTGTVIYLPAADHDPDGPNRHRLRAVGIPIPRTEAKVVDPSTGSDVAPGQVGEIWIKGPTVMLGYWNLPEQTAETVRPDGWLRTGDAGYQDGDGYFYVHDRVKDMIVSGGENIYPAEVENAIMSHPGVADVAVIGVPSAKWGETPRAMVVRAAGGAGDELTEADLLVYCRERLAGFKCPNTVEWIGELPRNPSGKVLKKDLRAPFWAGHTRMVG